MQALKRKKLFILDYHDLLMPYVNKVREVEGTTLYGSRTLFFLTENGTLRPIAIELTRPPIDDKPQWKELFTPTWDATGCWLWRLAKAHVCAHDAGYHQLVIHWLRTHCCTEPYIIAANRQLSAMHPIYRLLHPHFRYTMEINALARESLINAGGIIETCFSPAKYSIELSSAAYDQLWRFDMEALPADLIRRGMAVEDPTAEHGVKLTIEDYPFANDGLILWDAIKEWVGDYVNHYYPDPTLVESDNELQEWWTEVRTKGHADKKDEPWWPVLKTPKDLIHILTTIIWVTAGHHAAVNFGQYMYAGYFPNRPTIARSNMPTEDANEERFKIFLKKPEAALLRCFPSQIQATKVMAVLDVLSNHSPDEEYIGETVESSWAENPVIKAAFERFNGNLKKLEGIIDERNTNMELKNRVGAGVVPYELLKPFSESLITEKELKLRQAMTMMGLYDSAYWFSWLTWEGIITLFSSLFITLFGMIFQFDMFLKNNFAVVFLIFFLFQLSMIGFAFMLSAFISKSSSSTTVGFSIFIVGSVTQIVTAAGFPYSDNIRKRYRIIWSFFPPNLLAKALEILSSATSPPHDMGIKWSGITECPPNETDCVITISDIFKWLAATFFLWFVLALYFDNIIPNVAGVRKSVFYFLNPGYWLGKGGKVEEGGICSCIGSVPEQEPLTPDDEDVLEEENIVKQQKSEGVVDPNIAVQIHGLSKSYPGTTKIGCCRCSRTSPYHALKGLWVNFSKDQLFCLLGPNGAGKTTTINCLTGITPVTGGDALIYGNSVRSSVGMAKIRQVIGVCPQFDILWDALSGQEHLHLFASIKGLSPASIEVVAQKSLVEVRLTEAAKMRAGSYSGGMKRRLSVAVALIGDPKLVILDEPTTGMDPITRRHVWDIIEDAKKGRAIVLTTHSMEEADILSDRIGIMAKGRLRCIGTSIRLKSRFGTGFIANVSFNNGSTNGQSLPHGVALTTSHHEAVKQFFKYHLDVLPKEENKAFLTFVIPHDREALLMKFFKELQDRESEFGISDIQLGLTTLEEVFLNIARQAELETATAEGRLATLTLTSGALVKIPVGARFIGIPGTESTENPRGVMVEVYWVQDDSGALCISGHSPETPIPPNVEPMPSPTSRRSQLPVHGVVINPDRSNQ